MCVCVCVCGVCVCVCFCVLSVVTGVPLVWCSPRSRLGIPGKAEGTIFTPVQCQIGYYEPERVAGVCKGGEMRSWENDWVCCLCMFNKMRMYVHACSHSCIQACVHTHTRAHASSQPSIMLYV